MNENMTDKTKQILLLSIIVLLLVANMVIASGHGPF